MQMKQEKEHYIKQKYNVCDIEQLYYGPEENKNKYHLGAKKHVITLLIAIIIWVLFLLIYCRYMPESKYFEFTQTLFEKAMKSFITAFDNSSNILFAKGLLLLIVELFLSCLFPFIIPFKIINGLNSSVIQKLTKSGYLYHSPLNYTEYAYFTNLYKNAKEIQKYMESSSSCDVCIEEGDIVRICIKENYVSKEIKFRFGEFTHDIFTLEKIDFSVLDQALENTITKSKWGKSDEVVTIMQQNRKTTNEISK